MNYKLVINTTIFLLSTLGMSSHALAKGNVIIVKAGNFSLGDTSQRIDAGPIVNATFEKDSGTLGVEFDHVFESGFSIGGGYQTFALDYTEGFSGSGEMRASFITFNGKYYFTQGRFKPFIGGSAGFAFTDFTGSVTGNTVGLAVGVMAGIRYQFSVVGLYVEYKNFLAANTEDSLDAEVDLAGDSITAGISVEF